MKELPQAAAMIGSGKETGDGASVRSFDVEIACSWFDPHPMTSPESRTRTPWCWPTLSDTIRVPSRSVGKGISLGLVVRAIRPAPALPAE